jgi:hypothetical protein
MSVDRLKAQIKLPRDGVLVLALSQEIQNFKLPITQLA